MFNNFDNGCIILYLGPMFGSKSSALYDELIRRHYGGQKSLMVKKTSDTRYDRYKIETHDHKYSNVVKIENKGKINVYELNKEIKIHTINCEYLYEIDNIIKDYDAILIDEIQFYNDAPFYCDKWANCGKSVICAGLIGTYQRTIFNVIAKLIPRSEYIFIKNAICKSTGKTASFSERLVKSNNEVLIGGIETYKPVDRKTYFNDMSNDDYKSYLLNEIVEFAKSINIDLSNEEIDKIKNITVQNNKDFDFDYYKIIKSVKSKN